MIGHIPQNNPILLRKLIRYLLKHAVISKYPVNKSNGYDLVRSKNSVKKYSRDCFEIASVSPRYHALLVDILHQNPIIKITQAKNSSCTFIHNGIQSTLMTRVLEPGQDKAAGHRKGCMNVELLRGFVDTNKIVCAGISQP